MLNIFLLIDDLVNKDLILFIILPLMPVVIRFSVRDTDLYLFIILEPTVFRFIFHYQTNPVLLIRSNDGKHHYFFTNIQMSNLMAVTAFYPMAYN
jgi:hypothetical protein